MGKFLKDNKKHLFERFLFFAPVLILAWFFFTPVTMAPLNLYEPDSASVNLPDVSAYKLPFDSSLHLTSLIIRLLLCSIY
ncbi:MAG: hypothetical protein IJ727_05745, partial [Treponema sp.]|nr:hypothetical protein [Treponema sp.]